MPKYKTPHCVAEFPNGRVCGHEMQILGERDPRAFGPGWRPGVWVFHCGYCDAIQALEDERLDRYVERR